MQEDTNPPMLSRRGLLALSGASLIAWDSLFASSGEFWDRKDPSQWTGEEIDRLTTKSPWAKAVSAQVTSAYGGRGQRDPNGGGGYPGGSGGGGMGRPTIGIGGIGIGGMGRGGRGGGRGRGMGGNGAGTTYKGTVRWESAQPILDAVKNPLPEEMAQHYVLSIRDIPLLNGRGGTRQEQNQDEDAPPQAASKPQDNLEFLKQATSLQPKGREEAQPGLVRQMTPGGTYFLFGFSRDLLDFGKNDREVIFSIRMDSVHAKVTFDMKEMLYHGKLAV